MNDLVKSVETNAAPKAIGPYSQAVKMLTPQKLIFVSGQLPIDPATGKLIEGDIQAMTKKVLENIQAILNEGDSNLEKVVRVDIFLTDLGNDFAAMNQMYGTFFNGTTKPARQTVQVAKLPLGSPIEISCVAIC